jgi:hypothetical protein
MSAIRHQPALTGGNPELPQAADFVEKVAAQAIARSVTFNFSRRLRRLPLDPAA